MSTEPNNTPTTSNSSNNNSNTSSSVQRDSSKKTDRYSRRELIGIGAFKTVYKAYDADEGREVAWNQVKLSNVKKQSREKILSEIAILEQLHHDRIMSIYDSWESEDGKSLIFITEIMSSGTLKDFLSKAKKIKMRNVKKWCTQILQGLAYLHNTDPHPIIHRDLKCDNIFMNGNRSEVKIGDLGLSISMKDKKFAVSVIGTPEFMAPELYDEHYTEKVDIYAFGMCVLEMVTGDYPYCECENPAQVYRRVSQGIKPKALDNIQDELTKEFIKVCLAASDQRPSAEELLAHPFFSSERNNDITLYFDNDDEQDEDLQSPRKGIGLEDTPKSPNVPSEEADYTKVVVDQLPHESTPDVVVLKVFLNLQGAFKQIKFPYNKREDTPDAVASEMSKKFELSSQHKKNIARGIANTIEELEKGHVILAEDVSLAEADKGDDEFVLEEGDEFSEEVDETRSILTEEMLEDANSALVPVVGEETERPKSAPTPEAPMLDVDSIVGGDDLGSGLTPVDTLNVEAFSRDGESVSSAPDNLESIVFDTVLGGGVKSTTTEPPHVPHETEEPIMSDGGRNADIRDTTDKLPQRTNSTEIHNFNSDELRIDVNAPPKHQHIMDDFVFSDSSDDVFGTGDVPAADNNPSSAPQTHGNHHWADSEPFNSTSNSSGIASHQSQFMSEPTFPVTTQHSLQQQQSTTHTRITSPQSETPVELLARQQELYLQQKLSIEQRYQKQIDQLREQILDLERRRDEEISRLQYRSDAVNTSPLSITSATSLPIDAFSIRDDYPSLHNSGSQHGFGPMDLQLDLTKGKIVPPGVTAGSTTTAGRNRGSSVQQPSSSTSLQQQQQYNPTPTTWASVAGGAADSTPNTKPPVPPQGRSSSAGATAISGTTPSAVPRQKANSSRTHPRPADGTGMTTQRTSTGAPHTVTQPDSGPSKQQAPPIHTTTPPQQQPHRPMSQPNAQFTNNAGAALLNQNPNNPFMSPHNNNNTLSQNQTPLQPTPNRVQLVDNFDSLVNVMKNSLRK